MTRISAVRSLGFIRFGGAILGVAGLCAPALAEPDANVQSRVLANGLKVILAPSKTAQSVALVVDYRVGSANEAPGRSGFAHLFEHLMFEGTKSVPDFDKVASSVGGENNAFTQEDDTIYYITGPKEALPVFLRLDADRMANLANAVTQEDLDNQRQIVLNEMRQNVLDAPGAAAQTQSEAALYPAGHPYAHATIGSIADLGKATLEDVTAFHRTFYVPSNATVTITGNFDPVEAGALVDQTFGLIPSLPAPPAPVPAPASPNPQQLAFRDAVPTAAVSLRWPGPAGFSRQTVIRDMAALALSVGEGSLDNRLVVKQGIATAAGGNWDAKRLGGQFTIAASAAQGVSAERLETALREALGQIARQGISEDTLITVLADLQTGFESVPSNPVSYAFVLSSMAAYGDPRDWRAELDIAKTVTAADLTAALQSLTPETAQVSRLEPGPRTADYPPVIAGSTGASQAAPVPARPEVVIPEIAARQAAAIVVPPVDERKLASGATLYVYHVEDPANAAIAMFVEGGSAESDPGLSRLAMAVQGRGAGNRPLADLDASMRKDGISIYGGSDLHNSQLFARAPLKNFDAMAAQLAEMALKPRFDDKEWTAITGQTASGIEASEKQPDYQAGRKLVQQIYPAGSPEAREPDASLVRSLKRADAEALFRARIRPDRTIFHVAGNLPADAVAAALDKAFAGWTADGLATPLKAYTLPAVRNGRVDAQVDGATQAAIFAALPAPDEGTREATAFGLAVQVLGGDFNSRLNTVLREEKGWSYGISASASGVKGRHNALLYVSTTVQSDHAEASVAEIRRIIGEFAAHPVTAAELDAARRTTRSQIASSFENAAGTAGFAMALAQSGYALKDLDSYLAELESITLDEVNAQAAAISSSPMALAVAGDKAAMK